MAFSAIFAIVELLSAQHVDAQPPKQLDVSLQSGNQYVYGISDTHRFSAELEYAYVSKLPKWDRRNPNPPVSVNDAMLLAQSYRDQIVAAGQFPDRSRIIEAKIKPFDSKNDFWFWTVKYQVQQVGDLIEEIEIAVLMDGKVVPHVARRRTDTGWPPSEQAIEPHDANQTDDHIVTEFVDNLNIDRKYAGQVVSLTGTLDYIPEVHEHRKSGLYRHFKTNDGQILIFWCPTRFRKNCLREKLKLLEDSSGSET